MKFLFTQIALAALLAMPLTAGGVTTPTIAEEGEYVCWDMIVDGKEQVQCEPKDLVAEECKYTDPDTTNPVCKAATAELRPPRREWVVPESIVSGGGDGGGTPTAPAGKRTSRS